jgi:hypothetical protein
VTAVWIDAPEGCSGISVGSIQANVNVTWQPAIGIADNPVATGDASGAGCGSVVSARGSGSRSVIGIFPPLIGIPSEWNSTHTASASGISWTSPSGIVWRYADVSLVAACHIYFPLPAPGSCTQV